MRAIRRKQFILAAGATIAAPLIGRAQAVKKLPVLGILNPGAALTAQQLAASPGPKRLRELGWVEGETFRTEPAYANGDLDRLPGLAKTLVEKQVDVIWAITPYAAVAVARATKTIPIVFFGAGDPVRDGLVDSLAHPGRNATGVAFRVDENIFLKRFQLLREMLPNARRVAMISSFAALRTVSGEMSVSNTLFFKNIEAGVRRLGFELLRQDMTASTDFGRVAAAIDKWGADSLYVEGGPVQWEARTQILEFAQRKRLPGMYLSASFTEAGGLFSYGIVLLPHLMRSIEMVNKILRGAKPADIPVELPRDYELVVNM